MNNLRLYIFTLACLINFQTAHANDYSYNLKTAPVSDLIGIVNVELDIAVSEHFTLGPSYLGFNYEHSEVDYDSDAFGIRANYYFNKALSGGWLLSLSATYGDFEISKTDNNINYSTNTATRIYTALAGYQAMWNHFNLTFGIGASYFSLPSTVTAVEGVDILEINTSFLSGVVPNAEITLGWRF
ncbi:MAG TPA: DUF3575 domain-containing protein [Gammaproteobacteria bacterium]